MLKMDVTGDASSKEIKLEGRLDTNTSREFTTKVSEISADTVNIVLNLEKVMYISSAGLRAILLIHNDLSQRNGKLTLLHVNDFTRELLDETGLSDCLNIVD